MRNHLHWTSAGALGLAATLSATAALASSHREAPAITEDPTADNTDVYAWVSDDNQKLYVLANYIPLEEPAAGPNFHKFSDEVLYEVHIVRGPSSLEDALTYQVRFRSTPYPYVDPSSLEPTPAGGNEFFRQIAGSQQFYSVTKVEGGKATVIAKDVPVAPPNIGPRTDAIAYQIPSGMSYEEFFVKAPYLAPMGSEGAEGRVFSGPRDDGFYADLGGIFDLAGLRPIVVDDEPVDGLAGYNVHTIALEIPTQVANGGSAVKVGSPSDAQTIGVWASASRRKVRVLRASGNDDELGPWVQVSRLGFPLINEAVIGLQDKDKYNRSHPRDDLANFGGYFLNPILVRDAEFAGFYAAGGPLASVDPATVRSNRTDIIEVINLNNIPSAGAHNIQTIGDVLRLDLGIPSGFPNGRKIYGGTKKEDDVTDTALSLILTKLAAPVPDGVSENDATFRSTFPFLAAPWQGFSEGNIKYNEALGMPQ